MHTTTESVALRGQDYRSLPRNPQPFLMESVLPVGGAMVMYGKPKVGKSFAALQMGVALAEGKPWFGYNVPCPARVLFVQLDTARTLWLERLDALSKDGIGVDKLFYLDRESAGFWPFDILLPNQEHVKRLRIEMDAVEPDVVIIDTLREAHSGEENDSTVMRNVVGMLVAATQPAALILISHDRKPQPNSGKDIITDLRGSSYITGRMDALVRFAHNSVQLAGRAMEPMKIPLTRLENGLWASKEVSATQQLMTVASMNVSMATKAAILAERLSITPEAARTRLRRHQPQSQDE